MKRNSWTRMHGDPARLIRYAYSRRLRVTCTQEADQVANHTPRARSMLMDLVQAM